MGWATRYIEALRAGETVSFRPRGNSMSGRVESGALCTVAPRSGVPQVGDVVLCRVNGAEYLHLVKAVQPDRCLIGNNKGRINGWCSLSNVFGVLTKVEP